MTLNFHVKVFVFFKWLPLRQFARFREKQSTFKTSPSPACLRRDPQNLCLNGGATVWTILPEHFHLRQPKVCISFHVLLWSTHLWQATDSLFLIISVNVKNGKAAHHLSIVYPHLCHCVAADGALSLFNISREMSGFYICTSTNRIGSASCNITLAVMPGKCCKRIYLLTCSWLNHRELPHNTPFHLRYSELFSHL